MRYHMILCLLLVIQGTGTTGRKARTKNQGIRARRHNSTILSILPSGNCTVGQFPCTNEKCVTEAEVCNGVDSCGDNSDETFCKMKFRACWPWQRNCINERCTEGNFQCNNGKCINLTAVCDRIDHCGDGSDELRAVVGFKCPTGGGGDICVLPQVHVRDNTTQCNNDADESETSDRKKRIFRCFDKSMAISDSQQCDDVVDCPDLSDECPCEDRNEHLCSRICTLKDSLGQDNCTLGTFVCKNRKELSPKQVCDGHLDCPGGIDEIYCRKNSTFELIECAGDVLGKRRTLASLCDGRPECFDFSDECTSKCATNSSTLPGFCKLNISTTRMPYQYECTTGNLSTVNLTVQDVCNGKWSECSPRIPEEEMDCPGRFYCTSGNLSSIDISLKCNGFAECDDKSDEENCSTSRFYCESDESELLSVPLKFRMDGVQDCDNGQDECPTELDNSPVASKKYLIDSTFFQVWIWIAGFSCLFGNGYIIYTKIKNFSRIRASGGLSKCNHFFVFNLAIADSIMGIYLLGISLKHNLVAGNYCRYDIAWRTGSVCFWLGSSTIISSEASVFMLVLLTTLRLISVHYPLKMRNVKFKWAVVAVCIAWAFALTLGLLPHSVVSKEAFTDGAFIPSKFISHPKVRLSEVRKFASRLSRFSPNSSTFNMDSGWIGISKYLKDNFRGHKISGFYGYYSEYGICMPNLYVTTKEKMWMYSFSIIMVNFFTFIYILGAYVAIYRKATAKTVESTADRSSSMQRKVVRVIASDFLCWMPICIIAFLNLSGAIQASGFAYSLTAIVLLPLNSILNPFLYSNLCDVLWKKRKRVRQFFNTSHGRHTENTFHRHSQIPLEK